MGENVLYANNKQTFPGIFKELCRTDIPFWVLSLIPGISKLLWLHSQTGHNSYDMQEVHLCNRLFQFLLPYRFIGNTSSMFLLQNQVVTYSEPLSGRGFWFLWPVVFVTTLQTTAVLPDKQPWKNSDKRKIKIMSETSHTEVTYVLFKGQRRSFIKLLPGSSYPSNFWGPWHHNRIGDCGWQSDKRGYVDGATGPFWFNSIFGWRKISLQTKRNTSVTLTLSNWWWDTQKIWRDGLITNRLDSPGDYRVCCSPSHTD